MPWSIDWIELLGRVRQDLEMRYTPFGTSATRLSIAKERSAKDGDKVVAVGGESLAATVWGF